MDATQMQRKVQGGYLSLFVASKRGRGVRCNFHMAPHHFSASSRAAVIAMQKHVVAVFNESPRRELGSYEDK